MLQFVSGERIVECGSDGYVTVIPSSGLSLTCDLYSGTVPWQAKSPSPGSPATNLGSCGGSLCSVDSSVTGFVILTWLSSSSSRLTITDTSIIQTDYTFTCGTSSNCKVAIAVAAVLTNPTTPTITRTDNGFFLSSSTDVTRVYHPRGQYSCQWQFGNAIYAASLTLQPNPGDISITSDRSGRCTVNMTLSDVTTGNYPAVVTVTPGPTSQSSDNVTIVRPSAPSATCPTDYVPENTNISCTCSTTNIGQPGGRLQGYTVLNNNTQILTNGDYDVTSLTMTWNVSREDHVTRTFGCRNKWIADVTEQSQTTVRVTYGPNTVTLNDPGTFDLSNPDLDKVNLTCTISDVQPAATFSWSGPCSGVTGNTCSFTFDVTRNNDVIECTASNVETGVSVTSNSVTLRVISKPVLLMSDSNPRVLTVTGNRVQVTLDFIAVPPPNSFTIQPFGSPGNRSTLYPQGTTDEVCTSDAVTYILKCNFTIDGTSFKDGQYYELGVHNTQGSTNVVFQIRRRNETDVPGSSSESTQLSTGTAVGVTVAVIILIDIVVVVFIIVFLWRRQWVLPCTPRPTGVLSTPVQETVKTETSAPAAPTGDYYELDDINQRQPTETQEPTRQPTRQPHIPTPDNYSTLHLADIGVKSAYSEFTPYQNMPVSPSTDTVTKQQASTLDSDVYSN